MDGLLLVTSHGVDVPQLVEGQLAYFQDLSITDKAAVNISIKVFLSSGINAQQSKVLLLIKSNVSFLLLLTMLLASISLVRHLKGFL